MTSRAPSPGGVSDARSPEGGLYDPLFHTPAPNLYDVYRELRDRHPVFHNAVRDVWSIARFDDVLATARDWETFSNASGVDLDVPARFFGQGDFLDNDPPKHDLLRALIKRRFLPKNVKHLASLIDARVLELLEPIAEARRADLAQQFAWELPIWVICRLLGIPESDYHYVQRQINLLNTRPAGSAAAPPSVVAALRELSAYLLNTARSKRKAPGDDVLTELIAAVDTGKLDEGDLVGIAMLLFVAGSETTATVISNGLWLLDSHPDQQAILREGRVALEAGIEEIIRFESPIQYLARTTTRPTVVGGVTLPGEARVVLLYGSANRDDRRFPEADRFLVGRDAKRHLGFGNGIHFCLGAHLARLEARIAFQRFFETISDYAVTGTPRRLENHIIRGIVSLPAELTSRPA